METRDKTLFVLALPICFHHISPTFKCSCIWKKIQNEKHLCMMRVQLIPQFAFQKMIELKHLSSLIEPNT
jgi:hypothetical protein